jgi:hypothetical protein
VSELKIISVSKEFMVMPAADPVFGEYLSPEIQGAGDLGDRFKGSPLYFFWSSTQTPSGTIKVYRNDDTDEITIPTGIVDTRNFDGIAGLNLCKINFSANPDWYIEKSDYGVVLSAASLGGQTINVPLASFSIENRNNGQFIADRDKN